MNRLHLLTESARAECPEWDDARAGRVLTATIVRREKRDARSRLVRRSLAVASAAAVVVFVLLRGAGASTSTRSPTEEVTSQPSSPSSLATPELARGDVLAAHDRNGDGGYGRD